MRLRPKFSQKLRRKLMRGQALVEYVLLFAILSVFGQWVVRYFTDILTEGTSQLGVNLTKILWTGVGW